MERAVQLFFELEGTEGDVEPEALPDFLCK